MVRMVLAALTLASLVSVAEDAGYPLIFLIVMIETGCGIPFAPGEIATVTGGIAAADGKLAIELVIATAAAGAIVGDNIGYVIGRLGGRRLLETPRGPFARQRHAVLGIGDPFFERHGPKAVFLGRWLPVLRVYASWMAGGARMPWRTFVFWNAVGGIVWATTIGLAGYLGGATAKAVIEDLGIYGLLLIPLGIITAYLLHRYQQERLMRILGVRAERRNSVTVTALRPLEDEPAPPPAAQPSGQPRA
jgi:membrane-associated protein